MMELLFWRMVSWKRPSAYDGFILRSAIGMAAFWKIG
jgi:hypothetical protein